MGLYKYSHEERYRCDRCGKKYVTNLRCCGEPHNWLTLSTWEWSNDERKLACPKCAKKWAKEYDKMKRKFFKED